MKWSEEDKLKLAQAVQRHTLNGRIRWVDVCQHFPGTTTHQCKTEYANRVSDKHKQQVAPLTDIKKEAWPQL